MPHLTGKPIVVNKNLLPQPVLVINSAFQYCTEDCRVKTNAWLLEMFGTREVTYVVNGQIVMSPKAYSELKRLAPLPQDTYDNPYSMRGGWF